jgi:hypothetical protein
MTQKVITYPKCFKNNPDAASPACGDISEGSLLQDTECRLISVISNSKSCVTFRSRRDTNPPPRHCSNPNFLRRQDRISAHLT